LCGAQEFDRDDVAGEVDDAGELGGGARAETVVVLHAGGRRDIGNGGRRAESDDLVAAGGGGVLGDHEPAADARVRGEIGAEVGLGIGGGEHEERSAFGDAGDVGEGDGEDVHGDGDGHAVEVAAGDDVSRAHRVGEDKRVVGDGGELAQDGGPHRVDGVACGAEHLGDAAERVGVLNARVVLAMAGEDLRAGEQASDRGGDFALPGLVSSGVEAIVEECVGRAASVDGHGGGAEGGREERVDIDQGECGTAGHEVRAVDEGESFFGFERERGDVVDLECFSGGAGVAALMEHATLAHEREGDMGERGEVAGRTDRTDLGDEGDDVRVEHAEDLFDDDRPNARVSASERGGEEKHDAANDVRRQGVADAGGVGADEVVLEVSELIVGDACAAEGSEAGVDAVVGEAVGGGGGNDGTCGVHARSCGGRELNGSKVASDGGEVGEGDGGAVEEECLVGHGRGRILGGLAERTWRRGKLAVWCKVL